MFDDNEESRPRPNPLPDYRERGRKMRTLVASMLILAGLVLAGSCQESSRPKSNTSAQNPTAPTTAPTSQPVEHFGLKKSASAPKNSWPTKEEAAARSGFCLNCHPDPDRHSMHMADVKLSCVDC